MRVDIDILPPPSWDIVHFMHDAQMAVLLDLSVPPHPRLHVRRRLREARQVLARLPVRDGHDLVVRGAVEGEHAGGFAED